MTEEKILHKSVLLDEVLEHLHPEDAKTYLDCTFGFGGYSKAILSKAKCKVYAIDRDKNTEQFAAELKKQFPNNFVFINDKFSNAKENLEKFGVKKLDGIVLDLGVSSMQLDEKSRGFSFDLNSRLDMRMDQESSVSAYEVVNNFKEEEIEKIIRNFGEEKKSKLIAKKICTERLKQTITTCDELAKIVRFFYPKYNKIDPATKTFQGIRIFVNQELKELKQILKDSIDLLNKGAKLIVISFHSLEDEIVKKFLKEESGLNKTISRYEPDIKKDRVINFKIINKSVIVPSNQEVHNNARSRSAKMRIAIRT